MKRLLVLAFVLSASVATGEPLRASPAWLRLYLPIRPQLVPGAGGGSFSGGAVTGATSFLDGANFQIKNTADPTKIVQFSAAGMTTGNTITLAIGGASATATLSIPGTNSQILVGANFNISSTGSAVLTNFGSYGFASGSSVGLGAAPDTAIRRLSAAVITQTGATATSIGALLGGGANVASADPLPVPTGNVFHVTGTTSFTNITTTNMITGACFTIIFDGILTVTDGGNLKLSTTLVTTADDSLTLCYDGSAYVEVARSVN